MMPIPVLQAALETVRTPEVSLVGAVTAIVGLGKVWDKVVGHRHEREMRNHRAEMGRRLDEHAASDAVSFGRIDTSLAVLETGMGTMMGQLKTLDQRLYDARGDR